MLVTTTHRANSPQEVSHSVCKYSQHGCQVTILISCWGSAPGIASALASSSLPARNRRVQTKTGRGECVRPGVPAHRKQTRPPGGTIVDGIQAVSTRPPIASNSVQNIRNALSRAWLCAAASARRHSLSPADHAGNSGVRIANSRRLFSASSSNLFPTIL